MSKFLLYNQGLQRFKKFMHENPHVPDVSVNPLLKDMRYFSLNSCGFYRGDMGINIMVTKCAAVGRGGRAWSCPGYVIDRTPYGVIAHELGHHADFNKFGYQVNGSFTSEYSVKVRRDCGEPKLTNYCPNDGEWFAEMFRLFVTNPDLLRLLRPKTFQTLDRDFCCIMAPWETVLIEHGAPERTIAQARKKIANV